MAARLTIFFTSLRRYVIFPTPIFNLSRGACTMLTVSAKALGRKKPLFDDFAVPPPAAVAAGHAVTLRDLISHVVRSEVAAFKQRQTERRLLKALTARQIESGLAAGKVEAGGSDLDQDVEPEQAVAVAVEAFADGLFLVVVDETEVKNLDSVVPLTASSRLAFVRLTMLAGG
jgi:hypothetical protein